MVRKMENLQSSRVKRIKAKLNENPEKILQHFNINYVNKGNYLQSCCPTHNGDNQNAFTLWTTGYPGTWKCFSRGCENDFGGDSIGLISGILSYRRGKSIVFPVVLDYCEQNIGISEAEPIDCDFSRLCINLNKKLEIPKIIGPKKLIKELNIPSPYFLSRGYSVETLTKFCIGDCTNPQKPMFNRAVCPIFEESGENIIGVAGRRIVDKDYLQKWKYSYGFKSGSNLYGLWLAKHKIRETSCVILVEGMMDVANLHGFGYTESVGLFGVNVTSNHIEILNRLGVMNVSILLDGDEAGEVASKRNYEKLKDYFNVKVLKCPKGRDPDELSKEELKKLLW